MRVLTIKQPETILIMQEDKGLNLEVGKQDQLIHAGKGI